MQLLKGQAYELQKSYSGLDVWVVFMSKHVMNTICQDLSEESVQACLLSQAMILLHISLICFQRELSKCHQRK